MHFWNSPLPNSLFFFLAGGKWRQNKRVWDTSWWGTGFPRTAAGQPFPHEHGVGFFQDFLCIPPSGRAWTDPQLICHQSACLKLQWTPERIGYQLQAWRGMALPLAFQANKAARSLTSLQPRDWDACPHSKELCSIAFIRHLCRGLALWTCALKAQALSGCAKILGKQIAASVQCDSCWNVSNANLITLSVGSQTKKLLDMH